MLSGRAALAWSQGAQGLSGTTDLSHLGQGREQLPNTPGQRRQLQGLSSQHAQQLGPSASRLLQELGC